MDDDTYDKITQLAEDEEDAQDEADALGQNGSSFGDKAQREAAAHRRREAREIKALRQIAEHNEDELKAIFDGFHPRSPPDDYQAFKEEAALNELTAAVHTAVGGVTRYTSLSSDVEHHTAQRPEYAAIFDAREEEGKRPLRPEVAEHAIDVLATYGERAEYELSTLAASGNLPEETQQYALSKLTEMREQREPPKTLYDAFVGWLTRRGGGR